jgi:hypothetical protein
MTTPLPDGPRPSSRRLQLAGSPRFAARRIETDAGRNEKECWRGGRCLGRTFLASDGAAWISGIILDVGDGYVMI